MKFYNYLIFLVILMLLPCIIPTIVSAETQVLEQSIVAEETPDLEFTSNVIFKPLDLNNNGLFNSVAAEVEVNVITAGQYKITGELNKDGTTISARPRYFASLQTHQYIDVEAGFHTLILIFNGEDIFESGQDGPYELKLSAWGGSSDVTLPTPAYNHQDFGELPIKIISATDQAIDKDNDGLLDDIQLNVNLLNRGQVAGEYFVGVAGANGAVSANTKTSLDPGSNTVELLIPGQPLKRANQDGPYDIRIGVDNERGDFIDETRYLTQTYLAEQFTTVIESITIQSDQGIDTTDNGLFNSLQVTLDASFNYRGALEVHARLTDVTSSKGTSNTTLINVSSTDSIPLVFDFNGSVINSAQMDGPYRIEISVSDPITHKTLDRLPQLNGETSTYNYSDFDTTNERPKDIDVKGSSSQGIDNNGNGLFDQLSVTVDLKLAHSGSYEWSASLFDSNGIELDFYNRRAFLNAGKNSVDLMFDGYKIGENGKDGPYTVKGFLVFGAGVSLVRSKVATTLPFHANEFEGFVFDNTPPEINITLSQSVLWPPNHKMKDIEANVTVTDDQDSAPKVKLLSVTSNEDNNGSGDGDTTEDIIINHDYNFSLRAERAGNGSDRVYTISYQAEDASGNITKESVQVIVPHD
ncbi:MAG: hypothetical protein GQ583_04895 [Methyloprofundus sp.]|nr:hypothetical protein [Methyloprofundus sp.]